MNLKNIVLVFCCFLGALAACGNDNNDLDLTGPDENVKTEGDVSIYVTTTTRSMDFAKRAVDFESSAGMAPATIILDPSVQYQTMDGFGVAITGSTCFNLLQMTQEDRTKFLKETFSVTEEMGQSYIRIAIGCSDFSLSEYTCCDEEGIENFALQEEETKYIIPILKEILAINPDILIIGSPWTCPRWMKVEKLGDTEPYISWTGGHLNPAYYEEYGFYFVKWIQAMNQNGISIYSITPQNEPLNAGNSASLLMYADEQTEFIARGLGPQLAKANLSDVKIYVFDHNYNYDDIDSQKNYPIQVYDNTEADQYVTGAAFHNYGGDRSELINIHDQRPDKELIFTETSIGTWNVGRSMEERLIDDMEQVALGTINNWCKAVIVWNLMLDTDLGPNRDGGCQTCYGAVDIDNSDFKTIIRNSHYYIIGHLSAVVKPGAVRIGTLGYSEENVTFSAFKNVDGSYAVVLCNNTGQKRNIAVTDGENSFAYEVPSQSVVSYLWEN